MPSISFPQRPALLVSTLLVLSHGSILKRFGQTPDDADPLSQECLPYFNLGLHTASVMYSNLFGIGPDVAMPQSIRLGDVFPLCGHNVDLVITAETPYFGTVTLNRMRGEFLGISVQTGSSVRLEMTIVDRLTDEPVTVGPFLVTVQGLTTGPKQNAMTTMKVFGSSGYTLPPQSPLNLMYDEDMATYTVISTRQKECNPGKTALHLTECQQNASVSLHFPETSSFVLELAASPGEGNPIFLFGGFSNLDCPEPAHCKTYACPRLYKRRTPQNNEQLYCASDVCSEIDQVTCCEPEEVDPDACKTEFSLVLASDRLAWSNLGGMGPDFDSPTSIRYEKVFPNGNEMVDLEITNTSEYVLASTVGHGQTGFMGTISVEQNRSVDLTFAFYESGTDRKVTLPSDFIMTFFNFGMERTGGSRQSASFTNYTDYKVTQHPQLQVTEQKQAGRLTIAAEAFETSSGHPTDPSNFTQSQMDRTVSVRFSDPSDINLSLAVTEGSAGRSFEFAGWSALPCASALANCSTMTCPRGFLLRQGADQLQCLGSNCTDLDIATCCRIDRQGSCARDLDMTFDDLAVVHNNLAGQGPAGGPEEIRVANIYPNREERVDMSVSVPGSVRDQYRAFNSSKNGVHQGFLVINVRCGSSTFITLKFQNASGQPVTLDSFYLTVADMDAERDGQGLETVMMTDFEYYNLSANTTLETGSWSRDRGDDLSGQYTTFHSTTFGVEMDNPPHVAAVQTRTRANKAVTLHYANKSEVNLRLAVSAGTAGGGRHILISGSSSISCPYRRESCVTFSCPDARRLKANADVLQCRGSKCGRKDIDTCCSNTVEGECSSKTTLVVKPSSIIHDNFAGAGPDTGVHGIVYGDVFPKSGKVINMLVSNVSVCTVAGHWSMRSAGQAYDSLILKPGTHCLVEFSFVDQDTGLAVQDMWTYHFTFLGLDSEYEERGLQQVTLAGIQTHTVTDGSLVDVKTQFDKNHTVTFIGARSGLHSIVSSPLAMSYVDSQTSAGVRLRTNSFVVNFSLSEGSKGGRAFSFAGTSSLHCPPRAMCSNDVCPSGMILATGANAIPCAGAACADEDILSCCMPVACSAERSLVLSSVASSNLGAHGPDIQAKPGIRYRNVFPDGDRTVDLIVSSHGEYFPHNVSKNGLNGVFGQINLAAGSSVNITFHLEDAMGRRVRAPGFFFSFFDIDGQMVGGKESLTVANYDSYTVVPRGSLDVEETPDTGHGKFLSVESTAFGVESDNPTHPLALTSAHLNRSITVLLPDTGAWNVTLKAEQGWSGRNILFGGSTNLVCSTRALCSSFACPPGTSLRPNAQNRVCASLVCRVSDAPECCV